MSKITVFSVLLALASAGDARASREDRACGCRSGQGWCSAGGRNYCSHDCTTSSKEEALCNSSGHRDACGCPSGQGWCSAGGRNCCSDECTTTSSDLPNCASSAEDEEAEKGTSCPKDTPESDVELGYCPTDAPEGGSPCKIATVKSNQCEYKLESGAPIWAICNPEEGWSIIGISTGPAIDGGWKRRRQSGTSVQERLMGFEEPQVEPTEAETRRLDVTAEEEEFTVVFLHVGEMKDLLATAYEAWLEWLFDMEDLTEEDVEGIRASRLLDAVMVEVNGVLSSMEPAKVEELSAEFDDISQEEFNETFSDIFNTILAALGEESQ